jgi:phosphoribosylformylglycinamidine synthase
VSDAVNTDATFVARIHVTLKPGVVDPQGDTILDALHQLRFDSVDRVRMGKYLEVALTAFDPADAQARVAAMCATLLANPVIEQYTFEITPAPAA